MKPSFRVLQLVLVYSIFISVSFAQETKVNKSKGIDGTTAAGDKIRFKDGSNVIMEIQSTGPNGGQIFMPNIQSSSNPKILYNYNGDLYWGIDQVAISGAATSDNDWMISGDNIYSSNSGNVGIGSSTPNSKLSINSSGDLKNSVHAETILSNGRVVFGSATNNDVNSQNYGGYFRSSGGNGRGVFGFTNGINSYAVYGNTSGSNAIGVLGNTSGSTGIGVKGTNENTGSSINYGGYFETSGQLGRGVYGSATNTSGQNFGGFFVANGTEGAAVYADGSSTTWAGFFIGDFYVSGDLTVDGSFPTPPTISTKIDHPLDPTIKIYITLLSKAPK